MSLPCLFGFIYFVESKKIPDPGKNVNEKLQQLDQEIKEVKNFLQTSKLVNSRFIK